MNLPRRIFYHQRKEKSPDKGLESRINDICLDFSGYGYRRVTEQLQQEGWTINHKKVSRIMREKGLQCRPSKKKWVSTTDSNHGFRIYPNLVKDIKPNAINQVWVADISVPQQAA
jgi:transposase InsO family protein